MDIEKAQKISMIVEQLRGIERDKKYLVDSIEIQVRGLIQDERIIEEISRQKEELKKFVAGVYQTQIDELMKELDAL
jgi:hypothetical protein